jgi:pimeloyl-ACP methyl ester carboxylesterase
MAKGVLAMLRWDETATLPTIGVPTLIVTSEHDRVTLPHASEEMHRAIRGSELLKVRPAGHPGFLERSEVYDEAIAAFVARCAARAMPLQSGVRPGAGGAP